MSADRLSRMAPKRMCTQLLGMSRGLWMPPLEMVPFLCHPELVEHGHSWNGSVFHLFDSWLP